MILYKKNAVIAKQDTKGPFVHNVKAMQVVRTAVVLTTQWLVLKMEVLTTTLTILNANSVNLCI